MDQVVDTDTAREFMKETLEKVEPGELEKICSEVEAKAAWFHEKMGEQTFGDFSQEDYAAVLQRIFSTRGKTRQVLGEIEFAPMRDRIGELKAPLTLIRGVDDPGKPAEYELEIHQAVPGSKYLKLEQAGHFPMAERPDYINRELEKLMA